MAQLLSKSNKEFIAAQNEKRFNPAAVNNLLATLETLASIDGDDDPFREEADREERDKQDSKFAAQRDKILLLRSKRGVRQAAHKVAQDARIEEINKKVQKEDPGYNAGNKTADPINEKDKTHYGQTLLHKAAAYGNLEECQRLFKEGARTDIKDNSGSTPRSIAMQEGHDEVADWLYGR